MLLYVETGRLVLNNTKCFVHNLSLTTAGRHRAFERGQFHWEIACVFFLSPRNRSNPEIGVAETYRHWVWHLRFDGAHLRLGGGSLGTPCTEHRTWAEGQEGEENVLDKCAELIDKPLCRRRQGYRSTRHMCLVSLTARQPRYRGRSHPPPPTHSPTQHRRRKSAKMCYPICKHCGQDRPTGESQLRSYSIKKYDIQDQSLQGETW